MTVTWAAPASAPAAVTGDATDVTAAGARLTGAVTPNGAPTAFVFEYGPTLAFGAITAPEIGGGGTEPVAVAATLAGLTAGTTIYYRLVATNAEGTAFGPVRALTTEAGEVAPPFAETGEATGVSATGATLHAGLDARGKPTAFTFEYGTTTSFGAITAVDLASAVGGPQPVTLPVGALEPETRYLYRVVATSLDGTTFGTVRAFTTTDLPPEPPAPERPAGAALSGGFGHVCARRTSGALACWGQNVNGQLGNGLTGIANNSSIPVAVGGIADATAVAAGTQHTCALRAGGAVACWGRNTDGGQLGNGTTTSSPTPVAVTALGDAVDVAARGNFTCALRAAGTVACWGANGEGQLGNGTSGTGTNAPAPVAVSGLGDATRIAAGNTHACAVRAGGSVACWGANGAGGALGNGSTERSATPVAVSGLSDATAVTAGQAHTCALRSGGAVACWGTNTVGQAGNGTNANAPTPVAVSALSDAVAVVAGFTHTCALRAGGTVACWGQNSAGQLGNGTTTPASAPVAVSGLTDAVEIAAGGAHTCALRSGGSVVCWGSNDGGRLGNGLSGTANNSSVPVAVTGLLDVGPAATS